MAKPGALLKGDIVQALVEANSASRLVYPPDIRWILLLRSRICDVWRLKRVGVHFLRPSHIHRLLRIHGPHSSSIELEFTASSLLAGYMA